MSNRHDKKQGDLPYRPCVGLCVFNAAGKVFLGRRIGGPEHVDSTHSWQLPQGGIDKGEAPFEAALRELYEETSMRSVTKLAEVEDWLSYDLPGRIAEWCMERGIAAPQGRAEFARSIIESLAEAFAGAVRDASILSGVDVETIHVVGGGALNGLQHFEQFQAGLGIARNILSDRLAKLVAGGILTRAADPGDRRRIVYSLTPKGEELLPALLAIRQWGEQWGHGEPEIVLADVRDGRPVRKICVQAHDGRALKLSELTWVYRDEDRRHALATAAE